MKCESCGEDFNLYLLEIESWNANLCFKCCTLRLLVNIESKLEPKQKIAIASIGSYRKFIFNELKMEASEIERKNVQIKSLEKTLMNQQRIIEKLEKEIKLYKLLDDH